MKGFLVPVLVGIVLCSLGFTAMLAWYAHLPVFFEVFPGYINIPFNSALCLFLLGLVFFVPNSSLRLQIVFFNVIGFSLLLLAGLSLSQNISGYSLGLDNLFVKVWLSDAMPHPGRMSEATSIALISAGLVLILISHSYIKAIARLTQFLIIVISALSTLQLLSYLFDWQLAYGWYQGMQMSLQSAIGLLFAGIGLWSIWSSHPQYKSFSFDKEKDDKKIIFLGSFIIVFFALLIGFICYAMFSQGRIVSFDDIREKAFLVIILTMIGGMFLLYWQVLPLVTQMIFSKKSLMEINRNLQESENRFRSAFDYAAIGMALISPQGHCLKVNSSLCDILGYKENELLHIDLKEIIYPDDFENNLPAFKQLMDGTIKSYHSEQRFFHKNREIIWALVNSSLIYDAAGVPLYFILQIQNINAEKRAEEQLRQMAYHDPLTGLANRNKLEQYLHDVIISSRRYQPEFALIFLDLDNFKNVNDTMGHDSGDLLLQVIAERLKATVRDSDLVVRLGGDEFVLVINKVKQVEAVALIAQKILHNLLKPIVIKGHEIYSTTSIGISFYPFDGQDIQTLMKNADLALYRAKEHGRNNYQFCTSEMTQKAHEKMKRQNALSHALVKDEFELYYLPKVDLKTNRVSGVEALLRWKNKEFGTVSTEEIISLSEESGLIIALSEWILKTACNQVKMWQKSGFSPLTVAINLSPRQFKQPTFVQSIMKVLHSIEFPANCLELEITESLIMQDAENKLQTLQDFKKAGMMISIDDFGTGYSSMSYLKRFSVDRIKIDKTFMHRIPKDETNLSIVTATIAMAHKLGIQTIAEGVETKEQYEFLLRENCTEMQGYYLSRPLPADEMTEFLYNSLNGVQFSNKSSREFQSEP